MSRNSIFDPGGDTERSGSNFTGPDGKQISHMPEDVTDGKVDVDEESEGQTLEADVDASSAPEEGAPRDPDFNDADAPRSGIEDE